MTATGSTFAPSSRPAWHAWRSFKTRPGIGAAWQIGAFAVGLFLVFSRLPGAWWHPQFFAEDGWVWYQQAYNLPWQRALTSPQAGYLVTLPRIVAAITVLLPIQWAPLVMNLAGATVQVLPVNALLSDRCFNWGPLPLRLLMAGLYLAIPNAPEVHIVLTNAMWHLAVLMALIVFSIPPVSWKGRASDVILIAIGSVTGPFCILLLPCLAAYWWLRRYRWTLGMLSVMVLGAALQAFAMLHTVRTPGGPLGVSFLRLLRIVAGNIFVNSMTGGGGAYLHIPLLLIAALGGLLILFWAWSSATLSFRLFMLFAVVALTASLHDPLLLHEKADRWDILGNSAGIRYWFLPSLMFLWSGACCAWQGKARWPRLAGLAVLLLSTVGIVYKWTYPAWPAGHYRADVERFQQLKPGEHMLFSVYDPGNRQMELIKR